MPSWTLYARDASNDIVGELDDFTALELVLRFNRPSSWRLVAPRNTETVKLLATGGGLVVERDGTTVLSGPRTRQLRRWSESEDHLELSGPDDTVWLARRLAYPVTSGPPYTSQAYDVRTDVAETVLRAYVNANAGAGASSNRQVSGLTLAADQARGSSVTGRARFQTLLELLTPLALAGGDLGFRIVQSGTDIEFQVYDPEDKTASVSFDPELGNLLAFEYESESAEANYVIVAGGGEGTSRTFVEGGDSSSIVTDGRIEMFRDRRDTTDTDELGQTRDEELAERAQRTGLSITPVDTDALSFMDDYSLGDRVTVVVDGTEIQDVLREVVIRLDANGEVVEPVVGTPGSMAPDAPRVFEHLRAVSGRVGQLERR